MFKQIEDTSYSLKPLGLLCATLGVDDKLGQRPLHLTACQSLFSKIGFILKSNLILKLVFILKLNLILKLSFILKFVYIQNFELILIILEHPKPSISSLKQPGRLAARYLEISPVCLSFHTWILDHLFCHFMFPIFLLLIRSYFTTATSKGHKILEINHCIRHRTSGMIALYGFQYSKYWY